MVQLIFTNIPFLFSFYKREFLNLKYLEWESPSLLE
jgi:hypothetical protein